MRLPYYQVNAFTSRYFGGNPAGVCPLERWLADDILQSIAAENDLSETAFFIKEKDAFHLRWFTPTVEVDLCGHATLASAFVLFFELGWNEPIVRFQTRSGLLTATRRDHKVELDFPAWPSVPSNVSEKLAAALGQKPIDVFKTPRDCLAVFESQADVARLAPNVNLLSELNCLGVIATAPGDHADFVSRFFAPKAGIPEDPVTGSAHCALIPFWARRLGKSELFARQISSRGGELYCRHLGERVAIGGDAKIYCRGEIEIPNS